MLHVLTGLAVAVSAQSVIDRPAVLQPSDRWVVDFGDSQCSAVREYQAPGGKISLGLRPSPVGAMTQLFVVMDGKAGKWADNLPAELQIGSGPGIRTRLLRYRGRTDRGDKVLHQLTLTEEQMKALASAESLSIRSRGGVNADFRLNQTGSIAKLLGDCRDDLQRYWNIGEKPDTLVATPAKLEGNGVAGLFTAEDYPAEGYRESLEATAKLVLLVDEKGAARSCQVVESSGAPVFQAMGCQVIMERVKFSPALDGKGVPVRSAYTSPAIRWRLSE